MAQELTVISPYKSEVLVRYGENCTRVFVNVREIPDDGRWVNHGEQLRTVYIISFLEDYRSLIHIHETTIDLEIIK